MRKYTYRPVVKSQKTAPKKYARIPRSVCEHQVPPDEVPLPSAAGGFKLPPSFCADCRIDADICPTCNREPRTWEAGATAAKKKRAPSYIIFFSRIL